MTNPASATTHRRRHDRRGNISLAKPVGESGFAFPPSAAEKSPERPSLIPLRIGALAGFLE
jgi:hypothetical protein